MRRTPAGVGRLTGPATSVVAAPASAQARASAKPILPELEFVSPRTGSSASKVGPAVSTTRLPASSFGWRMATSAAKISCASSMRPAPTSPQACSPLAGPRMATPSAASWTTLRCVAGFSHIWRFIAGATSRGQSRARQRLASRSSARPLASFARKSAVAGATITASAPRERSMCAIPLSCAASQREVSTGRPVRAWKVSGATKRVAASVMTTSMRAPALPSRRANSQAL